MCQKQHHLHVPAVSCYLSKIETSYIYFAVIHNTKVYLVIFDGLLYQMLYLNLRIKRPHRCPLSREEVISSIRSIRQSEVVKPGLNPYCFEEIIFLFRR